MTDLLIKLLLWHFIADYPLQGDFLSKAKNIDAPIAGVPWWQAMTAHCAIHAGGVYVVTGSLVLAGMEMAMHFAFDLAKCRGNITFSQDQAMHVACKVLWAVLV